MERIFEQGSVRYRVLFNEPYHLTTLNHLSIADDRCAFGHPYTYHQLEVLYPDMTHLHNRLGIVRHWANRSRSNIRNSSYSDALSSMLYRFGLEYSVSQGEYVWVTEDHTDDTPAYLEFRGQERDRGSDQPVLLPVSEDQLETGGSQTRTVIFQGCQLNENGVSVAIRVVPERPSSSENSVSHWNKVMNYTFTPPDLPFLTCGDHEKTHLYFGMELELSTRLSADEMQRINTDVEPKRPHWFFFKQDSSITGRYPNKVEMVTVPMSPKRMRQEWKIYFKKLEDLCRTSYLDLNQIFDLSVDLNNGVHIHVSKTAFVQSHRDDHRHKYRFIAAFNQWETAMQDWLQKISKRPTSLRDNRYCYVHPGLDGRTLARRLRDGPTMADRHAACHEGGATVEVRIFQGIVDLQHILSCIDLTEAMFEFTQYAPHSAYGAKFPSIFSSFVFDHHRYKHAKEVLAQCA